MTAPMPYDNVKAMFGIMPAWAASPEQPRVAAYDVYDNIYWNRPETFKLVARGTEDNPIYIPSAKTIVEACNRYLAVGFDYSINGGDQTAIQAAFDGLFRREEFFSKFKTQKRYGLIRGDSLWHVVADDTKNPGTRISLYELDPRTYFPISHPDDINRIIGCLIVKLIADPVNPTSQIVKRQKYLKQDDGTITTEVNFFPANAWDDRTNPANLKPMQENVQPVQSNPNLLVMPVKALPPAITSLPVYHIKNQRASTDPFGSSEIRGLERIAGAINQAISDEELALALDGLGLYSTDSGAPVDDDGNPVNWILGPGRVVERAAGSKFERVNGIGSVNPSQDHLKFLLGQMRQVSGTSDTAVGIVNVTVAQSGIALSLEMAPLLAKNAEKEQEMLSTYDHFFYDLLNAWLPAYEQLNPGTGADISPVVGDPMPVDRDATIKEAQQLLTAGVWTILQAQQYLHERLGIDFQSSQPNDIIQEQQALALARDPFSARLNEEFVDPATGQTIPPAVGA